MTEGIRLWEWSIYDIISKIEMETAEKDHSHRIQKVPLKTIISPVLTIYLNPNLFCDSYVFIYKTSITSSAKRYREFEIGVGCG